MKVQKIIIFCTILLFLVGITAGIYNVSVSGNTHRKTASPLFVLQSSDVDIPDDNLTSALAAFSSKDGKNFYLFRQDTQDVSVIDANRKTKKIKSVGFPNSPKALAVNSQGRIFTAGKSEVTVSDNAGNWLNKFSIPESTISLAALSDGGLAVAATSSDNLFSVFDESGHLIRNVGELKSFDQRNVAENRFLNAGRLAANRAGEIYHVSIYSPVPAVQKFSKQGEFLKEFAIEGAAVEMQSKHADEFLGSKKSSCLGGYYVIRAATVDPSTAHLWIGVNGASARKSVGTESGVLYEYNADGEKLAEYALEVNSPNEKTRILTDVYEIAVNFPYAYVLTSQGKVHRFDIGQKTEVDLSRQSLAPNEPTLDACGSEQPYSCTVNCLAGSSPQSVDCASYLRARLATGDIIVQGSCNTTGSGSGGNGSCTGSITACDRSGQEYTASVTLNCNAAPTPTPTPTPEETPTPNPTPTPSACVQLHSCGNRFHFDYDVCNCVYDYEYSLPDYGGISPIIIDVAGNGFPLTSAAGGVSFDITADGHPEQISWTQINSDDAFLVLDRNENGIIDNGAEMFGNFSPQPAPPAGMGRNGFLALAEYDKTANGGNADGKITSRDSIFSRLRLWQDANHNGISEPNELHTLPDLGLRKIELDYRESRRVDQYGNQFKYRSKVRDAQDAQLGRWAWDVFLVKQQ